MATHWKHDRVLSGIRELESMTDDSYACGPSHWIGDDPVTFRAAARAGGAGISMPEVRVPPLPPTASAYRLSWSPGGGCPVTPCVLAGEPDFAVSIESAPTVRRLVYMAQSDQGVAAETLSAVGAAIYAGIRAAAAAGVSVELTWCVGGLVRGYGPVRVSIELRSPWAEAEVAALFRPAAARMLAYGAMRTLAHRMNAGIAYLEGAGRDALHYLEGLPGLEDALIVPMLDYEDLKLADGAAWAQRLLAEDWAPGMVGAKWTLGKAGAR